MDGRELMISVGIVEEDEDYLSVEFWDEKMGDESILKYLKTCQQMSCYKNGAWLIINKDKNNEIRVCIDVYVDRYGSLWVKARHINQDYESSRTKNLCNIDMRSYQSTQLESDRVEVKISMETYLGISIIKIDIQDTEITLTHDAFIEKGIRDFIHNDLKRTKLDAIPDLIEKLKELNIKFGVTKIE